MYFNAYFHDTETQEKKLVDIFNSEEFKEIVGNRKIKSVSFNQELPENIHLGDFIRAIFGKSTLAHRVVAYIESEDERKFAIEIIPRLDYSGHDLKGSEPRLHININLCIKDLDIPKNKKEIKIGELHTRIVENSNGIKDSRTIHFGFSTNGKSIGSSFTVLPEEIDKKYYMELNKFLEKLRNGKLISTDEIEFRKIFDVYSSHIIKRKKAFRTKKINSV